MRVPPTSGKILMQTETNSAQAPFVFAAFTMTHKSHKNGSELLKEQGQAILARSTKVVTTQILTSAKYIQIHPNTSKYSSYN